MMLLAQNDSLSKTTNPALDYYDAAGQATDNSKGKQKMDEGIQLLCEAYWAKKKNMGYRVQIFSGKSRWEATKVRSEFISKHGDETAISLVYQAPNFKLRVGNFRDRLSASHLLSSIKESYPASFLVKDEIAIPNSLKAELKSN